MISVEKYIELRKLPIEELLKYINRRQAAYLLYSDPLEFSYKDWKLFKSFYNFSTFGELFDNYGSLHKPFFFGNIMKAVNGMIISYLDISLCDIWEVGNKVLPRGEEVEITPREVGQLEEVADLSDPKLFLVIQQIIDDMEEERKALEASAGGETN